MGRINNKESGRNIVIFSDLDDVLLDHDTYSWNGAEKGLRRIKKFNIPLILCTSKTFSEVKQIQHDLTINEPFIVENGGGIFFPDSYRGYIISEAMVLNNHKCILLGEPHSKIRAFLKNLDPCFAVRGLSDMSIDEVAVITGLTHKQAELAVKREFSEPFMIENKDALFDLEKLADAKGFKITQGGKFYHLIGKNTDKGKAVDIIKGIFRRNSNAGIITIGFGDNFNDFLMLSNVDIPVLFPQKTGEYKDLSVPNIIKSNRYAGFGWGDIVCSLFDESGNFTYEKTKESQK